MEVDVEKVVAVKVSYNVLTKELTMAHKAIINSFAPVQNVTLESLQGTEDKLLLAFWLKVPLEVSDVSLVLFANLLEAEMESQVTLVVGSPGVAAFCTKVVFLKHQKYQKRSV